MAVDGAHLERFEVISGSQTDGCSHTDGIDATSADLVITNDAANAHSGSWYAWLCAYGEPHTDTLAQQVTVPDVGAVALAFWLDIDSEETTSSTAYDTLEVQIVTGGDTTTLATYSNLDETNGYVHEVLDLSVFAGETVTLKFEGTEDITLATGFQIDDLAFTTN